MSTKYSTVYERLTTSNCVIERFNESDFRFFLEITSDPMIRKYFSEFRKPKNSEEYFKQYILNCQDSGTLFLVIRQKSTFTPVGFINLFYEVNGCWMAEYACLESFRRRGYILEALSYICQNDTEAMIIFRTNASGINSLHLEIEYDNNSSRKLIEKLCKTNSYRLLITGKDYYVTIR